MLFHICRTLGFFKIELNPNYLIHLSIYDGIPVFVTGTDNDNNDILIFLNKNNIHTNKENIELNIGCIRTLDLED